MNDYMKSISGILNTLIKPSLSHSPAKKLLNDEYMAADIRPLELEDADVSPDNIRGTQKTIVKKIYRKLEVACEAISNSPDEIQTQLTILNLLGKCPEIITFHGLSEVDRTKVMVFEWASNGNLREFYTKNNISWTAKLQFVRDIFNGLYFIHESGIFHHDVQCRNILVSKKKKVI